ncbi:NAD-dependent epimerase/dehydratase family protein [Alicyclobacillus curvatus]|nr:NAD-dependent epimerase/dehydratase family protein [Alicyclobacillus curvatus]
MKKVLVTGGAGFIASHIVDALLESSYDVVIVDNLSTGRRKNLHSDARLYELDIRSEQLHSVFRSERPDFVIHQAAQASVVRSIAKPVEDGSSNIDGTINVLQNCVAHGVGKVVYASTAAVYGDPKALPIDENYPFNPMSPYALSKLTAERYIKIFADLYGLNYTILRYANVYGPRQTTHGEAGVISIFIDRLLGDQGIDIFGSGLQTRDFVHVTDVATANLAALSAGDNLIANVSTGTKTTINELVSLIEHVVGKHATRQYQPGRIGDILDSCLDNTAAKYGLNWNPSITLEVGLRQTVEFFRNQH